MVVSAEVKYIGVHGVFDPGRKHDVGFFIVFADILMRMS